MIKYNLEKHLKDNWFNTNDTFSLIEKWVDEKNFVKNEYTSDEVQKISLTLSYDIAENNY